jgi:hypothetical protein
MKSARSRALLAATSRAVAVCTGAGMSVSNSSMPGSGVVPITSTLNVSGSCGGSGAGGWADAPADTAIRHAAAIDVSSGRHDGTSAMMS